MAEKPDPELDELLDSAAKDFKKDSSDQAAAAGKSPDELLYLKQLEELSKQLPEDFEQKMQESLRAVVSDQGFGAEDIENRLKDLKLFDSGLVDADKEKEFSEALMGAMQSLRENLSEAFPAAREGEDGDNEEALGSEMENLTSMMHQMMLSLLSKEMLLPAFKEMSEKYPAWLEENKSKLSEDDFKRYSSQLEVIQQIVAELEKEGTQDDKEHFDRMVELMGKAQELGQPPQELTSQLGNVVDDSKIDAMLKTSGADQCNVM